MAAGDDLTVESLQRSANKYLAKALQAGGNQVCYEKSRDKTTDVGDLTVEQALYLIARGRANDVKDQVDGLVKRVAPLLAVYARVNADGARQLLEKLGSIIK